MFLLIVAIAVLSVFQILRYFFSYEDFSLLYGVQFPDDSHSIFLYPGFVAYLFLRPLVTVQYFIFGYNPFWYYLVSLLLFLLVLILFYFFMLKLCLQRKIALYATSVMASGYIGIESLTWNVAGGQIHLAFLFFSLLGLIFTLTYLKGYKKVNLVLLVISLGIALYFFQFRSYLLFIWVPLLIFLKRLEEHKGVSLRLFGGAGFLMILLSLLFTESIKLVFGRVQHVNLDISLLSTYLKNLGNLLFPSDIFESFNNAALLIGVFSLVLFILAPVILIQRRHRLAFLASFFSISVLATLVVIMLVIAFVGQIPTVWPSSHRFYIVLLPFVSGYTAVLLSTLRPKAQVTLLLLVLATHIFFSNKVIGQRWENLSRHLKYFYTTIKTAVPEIDKSTVLLTTLTRPYPPGPFVSGSDAGSAHFLAGFYEKRFDDFLLATEPLQAVKMLLDNNLKPEDIYAFDYKRDDIVDETREVRNILLAGRRKTFGEKMRGQEIELDGLNLSAATPVFLKAKITVVPKVMSSSLRLEGGTMLQDEYFDLFFDQENKRSKMTVMSEIAPLGDEHSVDKLIDGKYETTWIPKEWASEGNTISVNLGVPRKITQIVWSSSRTAPWDFRQPSEYEILVSKDGREFVSVKAVDNAPKLATGQFFTAELSGDEVQYIRLAIKKTRGGWTPAVDEIEVFEKSMNKEDLKNYFLAKNTPQLYFPDQSTALRFYREILNQKIPVDINWRADADEDYPAGQEKKIYVEGLGSLQEYIVLLPKTGRTIKSLRIRAVDFPSELLITKLDAWQPSLEEFRENKALLNLK